MRHSEYIVAGSFPAIPKVAVIILNYNGWQDTIECLESVLRSDYPNFTTIVCDNGSTDESMDKLKGWAEGRIDPLLPTNADLKHLTFPNIPKPIHYKYLDYRANRKDQSTDALTRLIFIDLGRNLGFAGGNNICMKYVLTNRGFDYVWLLNNDTVVKTDSLTKLVSRVKNEPYCGICGSTVYYYDLQQTIQTLGGNTYNKWFAVSRNIRPKKGESEITDAVVNRVEKQMDMVLGVSMLVSTKLLQEVGLMNEEYFLFAEEIDWATRAKRKFHLGYAPESIIYHKKGRSIGSTIDPKQRSLIADYYNIRSRLLFTKRFYPLATPTVCLGLLGVIINRLRRRQIEQAKMVPRIIYEVLFSHRTQIINITDSTG